MDYKNAVRAFDSHASSHSHCEAVAAVKAQSHPAVDTQLNSEKKRQQMENTTCLIGILSSVKFIARQGLPLRDHEEKQSNLHQLLTLRSADITPLKTSWKAPRVLLHLKCRMNCSKCLGMKCSEKS